MGGVGGTLYVQNYRDGTAIAKAKAKEALAAEKENIIQSYKESRRFREDACKEVANRYGTSKNDLYNQYLNQHTLNYYL